jgi:predicted metal-dependent phosphoesterase TrpH
LPVVQALVFTWNQLLKKTMCVDLHTHSIYSDGTATPKELVQMASALELSGLALTDHDTMEGCAQAVAAGRQYGVRVIPGLEISCIHGKFSLHILGYGVDPENPLLNNKLLHIQDGRQRRNRKILAKLADIGIEISKQELKTLSACGQTGRPHIARLLMAKQIVPDFGTAFRRYLGKGKPAYAERFSFSAAETISFIHKAGGVAILAHPGKLDPAMRVQPRLINELVQRKLDGLEIYYPTHPRKVQKKLHGLAKQFNLLKTGGSDYHGGNRPNNGLAGGKGSICPPDSILEELQSRIEHIRSN